jgi:hypothetical protein
MRLIQATEVLLASFERQPGIDALAFASLPAYREFVEAAEQVGFTGTDVRMDSEFADRSPEWVASADYEQLRHWVHTLIRADRWNSDYPNAVWMACRTGSMGRLVERLSG